MVLGKCELIVGDCLDLMARGELGEFDLVFGSPPYEDARTYGVGFRLKEQDWVDWMVKVFRASLGVCCGLVAFVVEGRTRSFRYSAVPALLMADLHRVGIHLRKPPVFHRVGIPGSGGPDWLRNDFEWVVCATNGGRLPWSDNTACGGPCKFRPGGRPSHRTTDGRRVDVQTRRKMNGERVRDGMYREPVKANPGNVIRCNVGGGLMGAALAHENEAPFPVSLAEFFVRSFCPPGGRVFDPFVGSGTTLHAAVLHGRRGVGVDVRESQIDLTVRRLSPVLSEIESSLF